MTTVKDTLRKTKTIAELGYCRTCGHSPKSHSGGQCRRCSFRCDDEPAFASDISETDPHVLATGRDI